MSGFLKLVTLSRLLRDVTRLAELLVIVPRGSRRRMVTAWGLLALNEGLGFGRDPHLRVSFNGPAGRMSATVGDTSELKVIHELFAAGEYELPATVEPDVIIDAGSNVGLSVLFFKARYPTARVIAVEPLPAAFTRLRANVAHLPGVTAVHAAVSDRDGQITIYAGRHSWAASFRPGEDRQVPHAVRAITLETLLAEQAVNGVDLLKMDIEGAETAVLPASRAAREAQAIVFEFHRSASERSVWDLLSALPGFELVRVRDDTERNPTLTLLRGRRAGGRFAGHGLPLEPPHHRPSDDFGTPAHQRAGQQPDIAPG